MPFKLYQLLDELSHGITLPKGQGPTNVRVGICSDDVDAPRLLLVICAQWPQESTIFYASWPYEAFKWEPYMIPLPRSKEAFI